jgi:hypothetical protein
MSALVVACFSYHCRAKADYNTRAPGAGDGVSGVFLRSPRIFTLNLRCKGNGPM